MPASTKAHCIYSKDLKQRMVYQRYTLGKSTTVITKELDMSLHVIQHILQLYEEIGAVVRNPGLYAKQGKAHLLSPHSVEFILALVEQWPDIYLDEIAEELIEQHNISISLATIQWTIKLLGITTKKLSKAAAEHCEDAWQYFLYRISQE
ncbi:hypothetical protein K439DRAFT_1620716 [Ramaria rubella]|nr:hypothetical protein K439DRAFT_1620716 [Ramaria rubella]